MIKAVIFDLGRVLVDVKFRKESLSFFGLPAETSDMELILNNAFKNTLFRRFNMGQLTPHEFYRAFCAEHGLDVSFDQFKEIWCSVFVPMPEMEKLFYEVQTRYPVGLLSDTDPIHWEYCRQHFPFLQTIPKPTLSFEIGALKPDPLCYIKAAENVGYRPDECLFIDDRPQNVEGAQKTGMQAVLFEGAVSLRQTLVRLKILE
jgi:putative hydrolase of the HAD superfamily